MEENVLARLHASPVRRWLGIGLLAVLGAALLWLALSGPAQQGWARALLALAGLAAVALGDVMRRATAHGLELTRHALRDTSGRVLVEVDQIARVHRGVFAFKPSNGFTLRLSQAHGAAWMPGLWWRFGRQLGVGGVIPGAQAKYMAEVLEHLIAERGA